MKHFPSTLFGVFVFQAYIISFTQEIQNISDMLIISIFMILKFFYISRWKIKQAKRGIRSITQVKMIKPCEKLKQTNS